MPNPPGLIKREIEPVDDEFVHVIETWDLTAPGCPIIRFNPDITGLKRTTLVRRDELRSRAND